MAYSTYQVKIKKPTGIITEIGPGSQASNDGVAINAFKEYVNDNWSAELEAGGFEFHLIKDKNESIATYKKTHYGTSLVVTI